MIELPQLLVFQDGSQVNTIDDWESSCRNEILNLFEEHLYGITPEGLDSLHFSISSKKLIFKRKDTLKQVELCIYNGERDITLNLLQYTPTGMETMPPCFIGLNFRGNQSISYDTAIRITDKWMLDYGMKGIMDHYATDLSRGINARRWPVDLIIESGYGLITCHSADIDTDREDWSDGAHNDRLVLRKES